MLQYLKTEMTWRRHQQYDGADCGSLSSVLTQASRVRDFQDLVASGGRPATSSPPPELRVQVHTTSPAAGENNPKKRKMKTKVGNVQSEAGSRDKRIKTTTQEDEESKITEQAAKSKQNSKASDQEVQKSGYIHVRARRGQATDSHSLAERARREKISERMKYLQNLVPGCNKIAGKAGMLDEIINYVQSLQQQVEFLSMKLAALNPRLDFINVDELLAKQVFPTIEISPETAISSSYFDQLGIGTSSVTVPETPLINSASFTHSELSATWGDDLQSLYNIMAFEQGGPPLLSPSSFLSQQYSGNEDEKGIFVDRKVVFPF